MRSTLWPNRIFKGQTSQNRYTCVKFSSKRENSPLSIKIVQNALFRSCAARFGQIAFLSVKVVKIVTLAWKSLQKGQKKCAYYENCTKPSFQVMSSTFWRNRIFEGQTSQNRYTCLKFSSKRENSPLSMKIVQNALFRSCAARFGQIAFLSVKVLKIVTLASNSLQKGKTVRFWWKLYKLLFSGYEQPFWPNRIFKGQTSQNRYTCLKFSSKRENSALSIKKVQNAHAQHVLAKRNFWAS